MIAVYKLWYEYWIHFDKHVRYGIGSRIDALLLTTIEQALVASYRSPEQKGVHLKRASAALDVVKFLLQVMWEVKMLNTKKYIAISEKLQGVGRMLGGWQKNINPARG